MTISIVLLAFVLRLINLDQSFWMDESIGALYARDYSWGELFSTFLPGDNHPPFYYIMLKVWGDFFGYSEIILRLPSVILGTATVYITYLIAKDLTKNEKVALFSALLLAVSPFHVYYSQEARMYAPAAFFSSLTILSFYNGLRSKSKKWWVIFSISITSLVFTDYVPVFIIPVFLVYMLLIKKDKWISFIASFLPIAILLIVWFPTFIVQIRNGQIVVDTLPEWQILAGGATFKQLALFWMKSVGGRISFLPKTNYYAYVILVSVPFLLGFLKSAKIFAKKEIQLLWIWLLIPTILVFSVSFVFPAFNYFRMIFVYPSMMILVVLGIFQYKSYKLLYGFLSTLSFLGLMIYYIDESQHRENWKGAYNFISSRSTDMSLVVFDYPQPFSPWRWYDKNKLKSVGVSDSISASEVSAELTKSAVSEYSDVYYFNYLQDLTDPNGYVENALASDFTLLERYSFNGVGEIRWYQRK